MKACCWVEERATRKFPLTGPLLLIFLELLLEITSPAESLLTDLVYPPSDLFLIQIHSCLRDKLAENWRKGFANNWFVFDSSTKSWWLLAAYLYFRKLAIRGKALWTTLPSLTSIYFFFAVLRRPGSGLYCLLFWLSFDVCWTARICLSSISPFPWSNAPNTPSHLATDIDANQWTRRKISDWFRVRITVFDVLKLVGYAELLKSWCSRGTSQKFLLSNLPYHLTLGVAADTQSGVITGIWESLTSCERIRGKVIGRTSQEIPETGAMKNRLSGKVGRLWNSEDMLRCWKHYSSVDQQQIIRRTESSMEQA